MEKLQQALHKARIQREARRSNRNAPTQQQAKTSIEGIWSSLEEERLDEILLRKNRIVSI